MNHFNYELMLFNFKEDTEVKKPELFTIGAFSVATNKLRSRRGVYEEI